MRIIVLLFSCLSMAGCYPLYYASNTQNVPAMKEKGQTNISGGINATGSTGGFELQVAHGLTDKIALQLNADWVHSQEDLEYNSEGKGSIMEVGAGYYKKISKKFVFETYGLVGFGKLKYEEYIGTYEGPDKYLYIQANFTRLGVQPSISFSSKYFIASLSSRFANVNYNKIEGNYPYYDNGYSTESDYLKANNSQWVADPAITVLVGFENVKLQIQYARSYNLGDKYFYVYYQDYDMISIGLKLQIPPSQNK